MFRAKSKDTPRPNCTHRSWGWQELHPQYILVEEARHFQRTMAKSIKDHLQDIFDDLGAGDQRKFKSKLCDRKTEPRIRRAAVEKVEDSIDLAGLMVTTFRESGAVPVTIEILQAIGCNEQAEELITITGKCKETI